MRKPGKRYAVDSEGLYVRKGKWRAHCLSCPAWFGNDSIWERITRHCREKHHIAQPEVGTHWRWIKFEKIPSGVEHRLDPAPPLYYGHSPSIAEAIQEVIAQEGSQAAAARALETTPYRMKLWMTGKATPQKRTVWERIGQAKETIIRRQRGGEQVPLPL